MFVEFTTDEMYTKLAKVKLLIANERYESAWEELKDVDEIDAFAAYPLLRRGIYHG